MKNKASIRISHDGLEPNEVTGLLGLNPSHAHRKGEANTRMSKKGKLLEFAPFHTGLWSLNSDLEEESDLDAHLNLLLDILEPVRDRLKELSGRGYDMNFFCGVFSSDGEQTGLEIGRETIKRMSGIDISLGICFYRL